jgi:hypothetical protein
MAFVAVIFGLVFPRSLTTVVAVLVAAWLADSAIDRFGHTTFNTYDRDSYSSRTPVTHSVLTGPIVGLVVGLLTAYLLISVRVVAGAVFQTDFFDVFVSAVGAGAWFLHFLNFNIAMGLAGIMTAVLHLFLDSLTEDGVYTPMKRWELAGVDPRDTTLNVTLKLAGLVMIVYVFGVRVPFAGDLFPVPLAVLPVLSVGLLVGTALSIIRHERKR